MASPLTKLSLNRLFYDLHDHETLILEKPYVNGWEDLLETIAEFHEQEIVPGAELSLCSKKSGFVEIKVTGVARDDLLTYEQVKQVVGLFEGHFAHSWSCQELFSSWKGSNTLIATV